MLNKCDHFCNYHCSTFDCPNIQADAFEEKWDLPAFEGGYQRVKCKKCQYYDKRCNCTDCYFYQSEDCPNYDELEVKEV